MDERIVWIAIIGMTVATAVIRALPVFVLGGKNLSPLAQNCLKYVPVSVLAAMVIQEIFLQDGKVFLSWHNQFVWAAAPALLAAVMSRNTLVTMAVGILTLALLRQFALI